jgi:predicted RNA-binding protein with PIN domain
VIKRQVIVDGYNLIRNDPILSVIELRSLDAGRRALISRLSTTFDLRANDLTVVFDGSASPLPVPASERFGEIKVLFSRQGETADTVIKRLIAAAPPGQPLVLLSDDRELRLAAESRGGIAAGSAQHGRPRPAPGRPNDKDRDEPPKNREKKGNPRRAKRRPRNTSPVRW